jgi:hypothetical protein
MSTPGQMPPERDICLTLCYRLGDGKAERDGYQQPISENSGCLAHVTPMQVCGESCFSHRLSVSMLLQNPSFPRQ